MTAKISVAAPRCLEICASKYDAHIINQATPDDRYLEGAGRLLRLREFPPFCRHHRFLRVPSHFFASIPFSPLLPNWSHLSRFLLHLWLTTTTASAYIAANLPRSSFFAIFFALSLSPLSFRSLRRSETVGTMAGVQRVQPSTSEAGLVSLVTAPHKGIAL